MLLNRELSFVEFKGFFECIDMNITEKEFENNFLKKYASSENGLSFKGFENFFRDQMINHGEGQIWQWFDKLGYD